ncbi:hypothetical protein ACFVYF_11580 [Streptomyces sp. NPDC058274]|uniref:hypothetical protein n=1 Tax=Streptomyces sp. NPDC058274 TaxID=3346416 RepID=UPI0036E94F30
MHGHGYAPPPPKRPSTGALVVLRVIFAALPLLSIGFLAWGATLRVALVTHRRADWWVFLASLAVLGTSFAFLSTDHTDDFSSRNGNIGMIILLLNAAACAGYFLYADIRHHHRLRPAGFPPLQHPAAHYGYPQSASPYGATHQQPTASVIHTPVPPTQAPQTPVPHTPAPPPQPARPAPARIDQVRAELDELSDYLRKHESNPEDGR